MTIEFKVYKKETVKEVVNFKLIQQANEVKLIIVTDKGVWKKDVLFIDEKGLHRCGLVDAGFGFPVDENKAIKDY